MKIPRIRGVGVAALWLVVWAAAVPSMAQSEVLGIDFERVPGLETVQLRTLGATSYSAYPRPARATPGDFGFIVELLRTEYRPIGLERELDGQLVRGLEIRRSTDRGPVSTVVVVLLRERRVPRILRVDGGLELQFEVESQNQLASESGKFVVRPPAAFHHRAVAQPLAANEPAERPKDVTVSFAAAVVEGARLSVGRAPLYDGSFRKLAYPGGDPGLQRGTGADLVVRAFRRAGIDLQRRLHQDIVGAGTSYGIAEPNSDIDHRRLVNLARFFARHAELVDDWTAGDLVFWARSGGKSPDHVGVVTDQQGEHGLPLVIHHPRDGRPVAGDVLSAWPVVGHYRWPADPR